MTTILKGKAARRPGGTGGPDLGQDASAHGKRLAAAILEVLAGVRSPAEAATALGLSVPRYYQLEAQGLRGLVSACEPRPKGRVRSPASEQAALRRDNQRLQRELTRQQALARAAQRAVGLTAPPAPLAAKTGKKPRRRRVARALSVAARLQSAGPALAGTAPPPTPPAPETRAAPP